MATDYWNNDAEDTAIILQYVKAVDKIMSGGDTGCFPMRFRMLPRVILEENVYSIERKKYLLKQMKLVLDRVKDTKTGNELFIDLYNRTEPYEDIFRFIYKEVVLSNSILLRDKLTEHGFFNLEKVKSISEEKQGDLLKKIYEAKLPYQIAMINFLGFIDHLNKEYFPVANKRNIEIAKWLNSDKNGDSVRKNITSLVNNSGGTNDRYTAYKHKEQVEKDYNSIK
ncbi:hypothetical protein BFP72_06045 [Reichenbachiella sp. 5M10]|uniref:hypothetical protein n=1 Tax=Reichenbachiella sp. 5M10 TaxID=1889772 RepID=UPI000C146E44|nr:hypothetical protein [Reichenbachiella sp. 5M10]PIB34984.1 hypothetical protein BFP72_06045 [Reichenbachiella sp. 5M10]